MQAHGRDFKPAGKSGNDAPLLLIGAEQEIDGLDLKDLQIASIRGFNDTVSNFFERNVVLDELQMLALISPAGRGLSTAGVSYACLLCHNDTLSSCNGAGDAASRTERCAWQIGGGNLPLFP